MNFEKYDLDPSIYDEMLLPDGTHREHCREVGAALRDLSVAELGVIQERVTRTFSTEGITVTVYGDDEADERIIPVDPTNPGLARERYVRLAVGRDYRDVSPVRGIFRGRAGAELTVGVVITPQATG